MSKLLYFLKESVISSRRNLGTTIGGIVTIFLSLLMIGTTIVFSTMIGNLAESFEDEVNVRLYISDSAMGYFSPVLPYLALNFNPLTKY